MFGNDCAEAWRIDNNGKIDAKRTVRERISVGLKTEPESWFFNQPNARTEFLRRGRARRNEIGVLFETELLVQFTTQQQEIEASLKNL